MANILILRYTVTVSAIQFPEWSVVYFSCSGIFENSTSEFTIWCCDLETQCQKVFLQNSCIFIIFSKVFSCSWRTSILYLTKSSVEVNSHLREKGIEILKRTVRKWKRIYTLSRSPFLAPYHSNNKALCKCSFDSIGIIILSIWGTL